MRGPIVSGFAVVIVFLTMLLAGGCASQHVKCDRHLVPINVAHGTRGISK